jgi:hypothetical protein
MEHLRPEAAVAGIALVGQLTFQQISNINVELTQKLAAMFCHIAPQMSFHEQTP